ncbi:MAG: metallophosphoesterase family protein [Verrucomicrobia bacterium]|nr:MAG: metallophosphoesterase family protein [Verrucomicrobiota bacterium]
MKTNLSGPVPRWIAALVVWAATTAIAAAAVPTVSRGPYLQSSTPTSIVIRWRTSVAGDSRVWFGSDAASLDQVVSDPVLVAEHAVKLTGLSPDRKYYYAVGNEASGRLAGGDERYFFLTHPPVGTQKDIRVWVVGDAGTATANQRAVRDAFEKYNGTNTLHAWLQLGDNAYNSGLDSEYQTAVFNVYTNELRQSVTWSTLGNHDTAQGTAYVDSYPYFNIFTFPTAGEAGGVPSGTEHYYSFDIGMVHFICLDSMTANRGVNGAMAIWLRSDLAVTTNRWIVAFWHHPPYTKGSHDSDTESELIAMRTNFLPILEAGGVDLVLSGHSHSYERSKLIQGHYGLSSKFVATNVVQVGSGRESNGAGAYRKPDGLGESPVASLGTVYAVAGSSGQTGGGSLNHPAMHYSANVLGSMVLDFRSNRLDAVFVRETGATNDWFTIVKDGTYPPRLANPVELPNGDRQFALLSRAFRTNIIEATADLGSPWTAIATNYPAEAVVTFTGPGGGPEGFRFYRARRP